MKAKDLKPGTRVGNLTVRRVDVSDMVTVWWTTSDVPDSFELNEDVDA
jgi:hypothetical protein